MRVFLSHTSKDKPNVRHVASYLESKGYEVWLDEWEMTPGDSLITKISEGVEGADKLVVFLSPDSIKSSWVEKELNGGLIMEIAEEKGLGSKFVIPVLFEACKVPFFLREKIYANFTDKSFLDACEELVAGIESKAKKRVLEPYSNAVTLAHPSEQVNEGGFETIIEFTSNLSPISGVSVEVVTSGYNDFYEWIGGTGVLTAPPVITMSTGGGRKFADGVRFERSFQAPDLKKGISYFVCFRSEEPLRVDSIIFKDGYGNSI